MSTTRLTRKERQAQTRSRIMDAATRMFAAKGLKRASVDEVAADAGYTKGAFYANFDSKEELSLAILDERFEHRIAETRRVWSDGDSPHDQARDSTADFERAVRDEPEAVDERLLEELMEAFTVGLAVMSGAPAQAGAEGRAPTAPA